MGHSVSKEEVNHGCYKSYKYEYKWTVGNFKNYSVGDYTFTPDLYLNFEGKSYTFKLMLFPHGYNERVKDYLSVYFKRGSPVATWQPTEMLIQFTCAVLDSKDKKIMEKSINQRMSFETQLGWVSYCDRDFLLDNEKTVLTEGNLNLICTLEIFEKKVTMNAEIEYDDPYMNNTLSNMGTDMRQLLAEGNFSDVTIKVEGQKFPAHKAILSARSAVFKAMLNWPYETNTKELVLVDVNAETVKKILLFIYSSHVTYTDVKETQELFYAADKYQMPNLKEMCSKILQHHIDEENAINLLVLGDRHSDYGLKYRAIKFIAKKASIIHRRENWKSFLKNFPELADLVFKESLKK